MVGTRMRCVYVCDRKPDSTWEISMDMGRYLSSLTLLHKLAPVTISKYDHCDY